MVNINCKGYDCLGNRTLEEQVIEEGIRKHVRYSYNKNGWCIGKEEIQRNDSINCAVTQYVYDESGNVSGIVTLGVNEIRRSYDRNDRLIQERMLDKKNGIDRRVRYAYAAVGNQLNETVCGTDGECLETHYQYDMKDRITHRATQSGSVPRYLYD